MRPAEFEEKEYEFPLYRQLQQTHKELWPPGQVLEVYPGFDAALWLNDPYIWRLYGRRHPLRGLSPYHFTWPFLPATHRHRLPRFRANCFVQVKCSEVGTRLPKRLSPLGTRRPYFRRLITKPASAITLDDDQCAALIIWTALKAIVVDYANVVTYNAKPFFSPRQRTLFRDEWIPPDRTSIWIGRLRSTDTTRLIWTYLTFPEHKPLKHLYAYTMTFSALEFVVQSLSLANINRPRPGALNYLPESAFLIRPRIGTWERYLIQIHPDVGAVRWPPPFQFGNNGFESLAFRVSGSV